MKKVVRNISILNVISFSNVISIAGKFQPTYRAVDNARGYNIPRNSLNKVVKNMRKISILHGTQIQKTIVAWTDENGAKHYVSRKAQMPRSGKRSTNIYFKKDEIFLG